MTSIAKNAAQMSRPSSGALLEFFRHHGAWAPGVKLFRRIQFNSKAAIISAVFMLPAAVLGYNFFGSSATNIAFSAKERLGVEYARATLPLLPLAIEHRARGEKGADAELTEATDRQLTTLAEVEARLGSELGTQAAHKRLLAARSGLQAAGNDPAKLGPAHGEHTAALVALVTQAADGSNLTLDPDLDTYYLMDAVTTALPALIDATGQLRDTAAAVAIGAPLTPEVTKSIHRAETVGNIFDERLAAGFPKIFSLHPEMHAEFKEDVARKSLHTLFDQVDKVTTGDVLAPALLEAGKLTLQLHDTLGQQMLSHLDELLQARIDGMVFQRNMVAGVVGVALCLGFYLFYCFYLVTHGGLREVQKHLEAMTAGDLTTHPTPWGRDEAANLMGSLSDMQVSLRSIVTQVRGASDNIVNSSTEISNGAMDLSSRTEQAAASLEQSAASMEEISSVVKNTAEGAREASGLATANAQVAERGGAIINSMVTTMKDIHASSSKIGDIIGTIDGIAFQTNILALNAAVEAARAGESGRGFAVVASEVRALAQRSASAAREIKGLITTSVSQVESGSKVVKNAGDTMAEMVDSARRINQLLAAISTGTSEQATGVTETTTAVHDLDNMTQQNAALVEQTAAAAASLRDQALNLASKVATFKLPEQVRLG